MLRVFIYEIEFQFCYHQYFSVFSQDEKKQIQERNKQELELLRTQVFEAAEFEIQ